MNLMDELRAAKPSYLDIPTSAETRRRELDHAFADPQAANVRKHTARWRFWVPGLVGVAATVTVTAVLVFSGGTKPVHRKPSADSVGTAILAAFDATGGDIIHTHTAQTNDTAYPRSEVSDSWIYPASAQPGRQVRFRMRTVINGHPLQDIEMIYAYPGPPPLPPSRLHSTGELIDVEYATRTWSDQKHASVLATGGMTPSADTLRQEISAGQYQVTRGVSLNGRAAIMLVWRQDDERAGFRDGSRTVLWVDAGTYFPIRESVERIYHSWRTRSVTDYETIGATKSALALLTPPIPPGFTQTATPHQPFAG